MTREFDSSSERLRRHGQALDQAAEAARTDIAVLLDDLPRAEATARAVAEQLRAAGSEFHREAASWASRSACSPSAPREADRIVSEATDRLAARLAEIDTAGVGAAGRVGEAEANFSGALNALLDRTSTTLDEIRTGIDTQAAAVAALVEQASAGVGTAGIEAAKRSLRTSIARTPRSTACRAAFPSRNARRSG